MCVSINYKGKYIDRMGDARYMLGKNNVVIAGGYSEEISADCCLCPMDLKATAKKLGLSLRQDEFDTMEYYLEPAAVPPPAKGE